MVDSYRDNKYSYNALRNPKFEVTATELALMSKKERKEYETNKAKKRQLKKSYERLLCSVVLSSETHDLVQAGALNDNVTYDNFIYWAAKHYMSCGARFEEDQQEQD